ncbi:hypothetical protein [Novosphingobium cyanobacteriorum]|uniref:Energy transducer TonB n=1 Tax=Novosphingobium cyanobacteriorum TaxID=3024215 RepID=A0ABT6CI03_9SPHN|nr:hypothetical protein [Novosphingobium cyanobacteriorum]MDF8333154.1 hypothetical protein [Novosphingobium cyanobacteriorum]
MLSRFPLRLAGRLWAVLLVLTIAFHAGTPVAAAFEQRSGSAFSADTVEMVVAPARRDVAAVRIAPLPLPPVPTAATPVVQPAIAVFDHVRPDSTGPPPAAPALARKEAPRGPPHA